MLKKSLTASLLALALFNIIPSGQESAIATEEAKYTVLIQDDEFELRDYAPSVQAEVRVESSREEAVGKAFNALFQYISGANRSRRQIAMTAPVGQSETIAMTAPVGQSPNSGGWIVSFMLPAELGPDTAPEPTDPQVRLHVLPARRVASVRYSGGDDEDNYLKQLEKLREWMFYRSLKGTGELVWARYNPPFTPPWLRRNEILLTVESPAPGLER